MWLKNYKKNNNMKLLTLPLQLGTYHISQLFGENPQYYSQLGLKGHNGIDLACNIGTDVLASHDGVIVQANVGSDGYTWVNIVSNDTYKGTHYSTIYGHLSHMNVTIGQSVKRGDVIGKSGNSGRFTTGPHLHWQFQFCDEKGNRTNTNNGYNGAVNQLPFIDFGFGDFKFTRTLKKGMQGDDVKAMQKLCYIFGYWDYPKYAFTGYFGDYTNGRVVDIQLLLCKPVYTQADIDAVVSPGGTIVGPKTRNFINSFI